MNFQQTTHVKALTRLLREGAQEIIEVCDKIDVIQFGSVETDYVLGRLHWFDGQLRDMQRGWASMGNKIVAAAGESTKRRQTGGLGNGS